MRYAAALVTLSLLATSATIIMSSIAACSSEKSASPADDPTNCGPGPYGKLTGNVEEAQVSAPARPKEDVKIIFDICADKSFKTGADGKAIANVTKGAPTIIRLEHEDDIPTALAEFRLDVDTFEGTASVAPRIFRSVVAPDFTPDKTLFALGVSFPPGTFPGGVVPDGGSTEPCQRSEGVTFSVPGHPEAKISYLTTDALPKPDATLTATTARGLATIENIADGTVITPVASKPGCNLTLVHDGFTGRATALKGYAVEVEARMTK